MTTRPSSNRVLAFFGSVLAFAAGISFLTSCAMQPQPRVQHRQEAPGIYNVRGWNYVGAYWPDGGEGQASDTDVDGTVGHTFYLKGPTARAVPESDSWSANFTVVSGELPPGLSFDSGYNVQGVPTERGHWIVKLRVTGMRRSGDYNMTYNGFTQTVRFHITGSGEVHD